MQEAQAKGAPRGKNFWLLLGCLPTLLFIFFVFIACMVPLLIFAGPSAVTGVQQYNVDATYLDIDVPNVLPNDLKFIDFDVSKLKAFLNSKNSILADEPYISTIIDVAKEKDVNALFLFAITGQEQAYVPRSDMNAYIIANNPFNVNHSWYEYNTGIRDSCTIAANTIINLSSDRPASVNVVMWINLRGGSGGYAEDPNWWIGVSRNFEQIQKAVM